MKVIGTFSDGIPDRRTSTLPAIILYSCVSILADIRLLDLPNYVTQLGKRTTASRDNIDTGRRSDASPNRVRVYRRSMYRGTGHTLLEFNEGDNKNTVGKKRLGIRRNLELIEGDARPSPPSRSWGSDDLQRCANGSSSILYMQPA